ncbi:MAG: MotA/TolQ/ExbB proton channel family protein [Thermodesulfobacteriota bacterium]
MIVSDTEIIRLVANAGPMVRLVLLLLLAFSVACWAIIFAKIVQYRRAVAQNSAFLQQFWKTADLSKTYAAAKAQKGSPVARAFRVGYAEMGRVFKMPQAAEAAPGEPEVPLGRFSGTHNIERALRRAGQMEITRLGRYVPFLATTGNTAPFIGLFGTVWGIMSAFHGIGLRGSASLAVVAPGISEALVATAASGLGVPPPGPGGPPANPGPGGPPAAGLAAAIPAVIAYNQFMSRLRGFEDELSMFSADLLNILEREVIPAQQGQRP